jgi:hypothetical protein
MHSLKIECPNGHLYREYEEKIPWPDGAPHCPLCCKSWIYTHPTWSYIRKLKEMAKIRRVLEKVYVNSYV